VWRIAAASQPASHYDPDRRARRRPDGRQPNPLSELVTGRNRPCGFLDALERGAESAGQRIPCPYRRRFARRKPRRRDAIAFAAGQARDAFSESLATSARQCGPITRHRVRRDLAAAPGRSGWSVCTPRCRSCAARSTSSDRTELRSPQQYKSAVNFLTETEMTAPQREVESCRRHGRPDRPRHRRDRHLSESEVQADRPRAIR
jgi:hypothetical protein